MATNNNTPKDGAATQQPAPAQQPVTNPVTPQPPTAPTAPTAPTQPTQAPAAPAQGAQQMMQYPFYPQMMGYGFAAPQMQYPYAPQAPAAPAQPAAPAAPAQLDADQAGVLEENLKKMIADYEAKTGKKFTYGADDEERSWFEEHYIITAAIGAVLFTGIGYGIATLVNKSAMKKARTEGYNAGWDACTISTKTDKSIKSANAAAPNSPAAQNRGPANNN